jgi:hypothetical protein
MIATYYEASQETIIITLIFACHARTVTLTSIITGMATLTILTRHMLDGSHALPPVLRSPDGLEMLVSWQKTRRFQTAAIRRKM